MVVKRLELKSEMASFGDDSYRTGWSRPARYELVRSRVSYVGSC